MKRKIIPMARLTYYDRLEATKKEIDDLRKSMSRTEFREYIDAKCAKTIGEDNLNIYKDALEDLHEPALAYQYQKRLVKLGHAKPIDTVVQDDDSVQVQDDDDVTIPSVIIEPEEEPEEVQVGYAESLVTKFADFIKMNESKKESEKVINIEDFKSHYGKELKSGYKKAKADGAVHNKETEAEWIVSEYDAYKENPKKYEVPYNGLLDSRHTKTVGKLNETGEWNDDDEDDAAWLKVLIDAMKTIASKTDGKFVLLGAQGFDKYQGPYANVKINGKPYTVWTTENDDFWIDGYPVDNTGDDKSRPGFEGSAIEIADIIENPNGGEVGESVFTTFSEFVSINEKASVVKEDELSKHFSAEGIKKIKAAGSKLANVEGSDGVTYCVRKKKGDTGEYSFWKGFGKKTEK